MSLICAVIKVLSNTFSRLSFYTNNIGQHNVLNKHYDIKFLHTVGEDNVKLFDKGDSSTRFIVYRAICNILADVEIVLSNDLLYGKTIAYGVAHF